MKADQGRQPAQEQIDLAKLRKRLQRPRAHEAVIRVVIGDIHAQRLHQAIEHQRRAALEGGIGIAPVAHAIDHIASFPVLFDKAVHGIHIVLQIRIHRNGHVAAAPRGHQPGQQRVLVAPVAAELDPLKQRVFLVQGADQLPGAVAAAVIHQKDAALRRDQALPGQLSHLFHKPARGFRQHLLLVVTGDNHHQFVGH